MSEQVKIERTIHLDIVCGLLVLWMIFGDHLRYMSGIQTFPGYDILRRLFFFFMAWFFFKSGMFYCDKRTVKEVIRHDWQKLGQTYLIGCSLAIILQLVYQLLLGHLDIKTFIIRNLIDVFNHGGASWNIALWFLMSLYVVKVLFSWMISKIPAIWIAIVTVLICWWFNKMGVFRPACIGNIPLGLFFYSCGYMMKDWQYQRLPFVSALIVGGCIFSLNAVNSFGFRINRVSSDDVYFVVIVACICNILIFNNIFKKITPPILEFIGKNSMTFYVLHFPLGMLFSSIGIDLLCWTGMRLYVFTCITTIGGLILLYFLIERTNNKYLKMIIGK
jgi:hypothetical protein